MNRDSSPSRPCSGRSQCRRIRRQCGFTLIELLIVVAIIGVLAAVLLPRLLETREVAEVTATKATMLQLENAVKHFQGNHGYYPSDDLSYVEKNVTAKWSKDNGRNTGIESLVCLVSQSKTDGTDLGGLSEYFVNTDGDKNGVGMPLLGNRSDRIEIADAWLTPLVYFAKFGMDRPQTVVPGDALEPVQVKAMKKPDGAYFGAGKYQILSAGKDLTFGTDDDLVWPES